MKKWTMIAAGFALSIPAVAVAQPPQDGGRMFATIDANGDGKLDAQEVTVWMEARRAEREAQMAARMIARMDADGDGALTLVELPGADMPNRLGWLDRNADGAVDAEEFAEMPGDGPGKGPGHGPGRGGHPRGDACGPDGGDRP